MPPRSPYNGREGGSKSGKLENEKFLGAPLLFFFEVRFRRGYFNIFQHHLFVALNLLFE